MESENLTEGGDDFSGLSDKTIRVQVLLDADEFLSVRDLSAGRGISQSSFFRQLLNNERKRLADEKLSIQLQAVETLKSTQGLHTEDLQKIASIVAKMIGANHAN